MTATKNWVSPPPPLWAASERARSLYVYIYIGVSYSLSYSPCCVRAQGSVHYALDWLRKGCWGARAERRGAGINLPSERHPRLWSHLACYRRRFTVSDTVLPLATPL